MKDALRTAWTIYSTIIAVMLLCLFILPGELLINNTPLCENISKFGVECFACGMTRGFVDISQFEFNEAGIANRGSLYVFFIFFINSLLFIKYLFNFKKTKK